MKAFLVLQILLTLSANVYSADITKGKLKSAACAACHGQKGISQIPHYPNLAGQHALYTENQLKAFRDGSRKNPIMSPMAKGLSDEDIENLAAYYEKILNSN